MALAMQEPDDGGSVDLADSTVNDGASLITLDPQLTFSNSWWWYYATITGTDGRTPTLDIANRDGIFNSASLLSGHGFWSYGLDQPWRRWDVTSLESSPNRIRFQNSSPFTADTIHVAYYPVFPLAKMIAAVEAWVLSDYVHPTTSSNSSLILGTTAERSNNFGRTCPQANLYGFKIEDTSETGPKNVGLLVNGTHPGEHAASWAFEAAIEFLLSEAPHAQFLREHWVFFVYPDVNPQGRYGGLFRTAPDASTSDYNRIWGGTTSGTCASFRDAILVDTDEQVNLLLDFHAYNHSYSGDTRRTLGLVYNPASLQHPAWRTAMRNFDLTWDTVDFPGSPAGTVSLFANSNLNTDDSVAVSATMELGSLRSYTHQNFIDCGPQAMFAISEATSKGLFPVQASRTKAPSRREAYSGYRAA